MEPSLPLTLSIVLSGQGTQKSYNWEGKEVVTTMAYPSPQVL